VPPAGSDAATAVRVGTFNIVAGSSTGTFASAVAQTVPNVDVLGLQEVNTKEKEAAMQSLLAAGGWSYWREHRKNIPEHPTEGGAEQTPVLWRADRFDLLAAEKALMSPAFDLHGESPAYDDRKPHYFSVVRLKDRWTGQYLSILNVHTVHGAVRSGRPEVGKPWHYRLWVKQVKAIRDRAAAEQALGYRTLVLGDFNSGWLWDMKARRRTFPIRRLASVGLVSNWALARPTKRGTAGTNLIDQIYADRLPVSTAVLFGISGSDHFPAVATYDFAG
jgi:endonuclease/exonuclease/phosphatase family metal-dependent hydrolase